MTYPFPNFNVYTIEVWECMSNSIPHFARHVITNVDRAQGSVSQVLLYIYIYIHVFVYTLTQTYIYIYISDNISQLAL